MISINPSRDQKAIDCLCSHREHEQAEVAEFWTFISGSPQEQSRSKPLDHHDEVKNDQEIKIDLHLKGSKNPPGRKE